MMASDELDGELAQLADSLIDSLGIKVPSKSRDDYSFLTSDSFYVEVFKAILAHSPHPLDQAQFDRETKSCSSAERIQALINKLGSEVLKMDISHIKGDKIAKGNIKNISDMLQLLEALWQNYNHYPSDGEEENLAVKMESDLNDNESLHQEDELNDPSKRQPKTKPEKYQNKGDLYDQMVQDSGLAQPTFKPAPGIPIYSEDPINYKDMVLEPKYGAKPKSKKAVPSANSLQMVRQPRPKTAGISSKKAEVVRRIENNVYGVARDRNLKTRNLSKEVITGLNRKIL